MRRISFFVCLALLALPLIALGQDPSPAVSVELPAAGLSPELQYLLGAGPIGALLYGAYLLGKGVTVRVQVHLDDEDRALVRRGVEALEKFSASPPAPPG